MSVIRRKTPKVHLSDVASPKPTRATSKALDKALLRAHADQKAILRQARTIKAS